MKGSATMRPRRSEERRHHFPLGEGQGEGRSYEEKRKYSSLLRYLRPLPQPSPKGRGNQRPFRRMLISFSSLVVLPILNVVRVNISPADLCRRAWWACALRRRFVSVRCLQRLAF